MWYCIISTIYICLGVFTFWASRDLAEDMIDDIDEQDPISSKAAVAFYIVMCIFWPVTLFGFGAGWGCNNWYANHRAKVNRVIWDMVKKSGKPEPFDDAGWRKFFCDNIHKMPRKQLVRLEMVGSNSMNIKEDTVKMIVASELADRDLLGNKF